MSAEELIGTTGTRSPATTRSFMAFSVKRTMTGRTEQRVLPRLRYEINVFSHLPIGA